ncbi:hypothetical protein ASG99_14735 [Bacillus sp. Soil768D1]|nr:hypothetical protein ASG99_14735 [Bacillus sp. Soil768D1]
MGNFVHDMLSSFFSHKIGLTTILDFVESYFNEEFDKKRFDKGLTLCNKIFSVSEDQLGEQLDLFIKFAELTYPEHIDKDIGIHLKRILVDEEKLTSF